MILFMCSRKINNFNLKRAFLIIFLVFYSIVASSSTVSICSWNLKDFGKSKSDNEIAFIANILKNYDVVAIQEVVAGDGGGQAVARLVNELDRKGSKWDYSISDP